MLSRTPLFRRQALDYYTQSREKTILPRLIRPPVFLLLWILLGLACAAMMVAWIGQVPVYVGGPGIVRERTLIQHGQQVRTAQGLIFVPVDPAHAIPPRTGAPVQLQVGTSKQSFTARVDGVEPGVLNPEEIQQRYTPGSKISSLLTGPSIVVSIALDPEFASPVYAGSVIYAQVQVGSTSVLSSLFESAQLGGE
jgi:hypothetical protein